MAKEKTTRRQKDVSRLLREKKKLEKTGQKRVKRNSERAVMKKTGRFVILIQDMMW